MANTSTNGLPAAPGNMSDEQIMEIAHRTATRYTHRSDSTESSYGFMRHTLLDFARKVLAAAGLPASDRKN